MTPSKLSRRDFLIRTGVLGAFLTIVGQGGIGALRAMAQTPDDLEPVLAQIKAVLEELSRDTFGGLAAFVVPGDDPYSVAQGVTAQGPGAVGAKMVEFLLASADDFVPFPDRNTSAIGVALSEGLGSLPPEIAGVPFTVTDQLDEAMRMFAENDQTVPLSLVFALAMNQLAVATNPASLGGTFMSPFANLSWDDKLVAWEMFEQANPDLVAMIDGALPEPQSESVSGVVRFAAGALLEFAAFGTYTEFSTFDPATRALTGRPVGWALSGYQPGGPVRGWDEFKGYYQGRTKAVD
jgi:hypothetical protein